MLALTHAGIPLKSYAVAVATAFVTDDRADAAPLLLIDPAKQELSNCTSSHRFIFETVTLAEPHILMADSLGCFDKSEASVSVSNLDGYTNYMN